MSEENKLFIGGLCPKTDNSSMLDYFKPYGEISDCVVMKDPHTKMSRGFGFVTFVERSSSDECLSKKDHVIDGRSVEVKRAVPKKGINPSSNLRTKKIFLGGMALETTKQEIIEALEKVCGPGTVADVQIMTDKHTNKPRGFGFAIFQGEEEAYEVVDNLVASHQYIKIGERDVEVKVAKPREEMKTEDTSYRRSNSYGRQSTYPSSRGMYEGRGMASGYYGGSSYDNYMPPQRGGGRDYGMSAYASMGGGYGYDTSYYGKYYSGMMPGMYPQAASNYGPTRSYGDYRERSDRGSYYPYPPRQ